MTIDLEGARCDEEAARLLPWFVAGTLTAADADRVARHLEHCAICRSDAQHERTVRALLKADARVEYAPQPGLSKTLERIDELTAEPAVPTGAARVLGRTRWLAAAVVVQAIGLGAFAAYLYGHTPVDPHYRTLSSDAPGTSGPEVRAVFSPAMTLSDLTALLVSEHLTIVHGPSDAGAYTLASTAPASTRENLPAVVAALRRDPHAIFVEPVYDGRSDRP
jgi:hypothetical protein